MDPRQLVNQLRSASPQLPFEVPINGSTLRCTELLRHLNGKRLVCGGTLDDREVVAKIYIDPARAGVHAEREARGARAMLARGVRTADLLATACAGEAHIVVYERIFPARTASEAWDASLHEAERGDLFRKLVEAVALQHDAGLLQEDLHLGNFLLRDDDVYTLDAAAIAVQRGPIAPAKALDNLALLCAQLPPEHDCAALAAFDDYARVRNWSITPRDRATLRHAITQRRARRERIYLKKIFRESSAFVSRKCFDHYYVCDRRDYSAAMQQALDDPESLFTNAHYLKRGNTATVAVTHIDGRAVVIKRYNLKNAAHALKRAFQPTRAAISWRNAQRLRFYDIATPRPIALIERRIGPLRRVSYFLAEHSQGEDCAQFLTRADISEQRRTAVAERIVALIERLRALNLSHGDMKATNILIAADQPALIDLDAMRKHSNTAAASHALQRDLQRFMQNWENSPAAAHLFKALLEANGTVSTSTDTIAS